MSISLDLPTTLEQVREWYCLVDAGYNNPHHPIMAGSPDCPTCVAEANLNSLFSPSLGKKLVEALAATREARLATGRQSTCDKQVHGDSHIRCGKCFICLEEDALTHFYKRVQKVQHRD